MVDGTVIGVDLGGTKVSVGAVVGREVLRTERRRISAMAAEDVVLGEVMDTIAAVFDSSVVGIGCGVPSVVDVETGVVFQVENIPSWRRVPLKAVLEERFRVPVCVNNDANAFAVGEHIFGQGRSFRNMVGLTLGTGLGAGIIVDGRLYCGRNCGAGEIGMIPHKGKTLEDFCSGRFFLTECGTAGEALYQRALAGDAEARSCFEEFGRELAEAIMIVVYAYDPDAVVLGGSVSAAFELFRRGLTERLERAYKPLTEGLVIAVSELGNAAVLGAAALYLDANTRDHALRFARKGEMS